MRQRRDLRSQALRGACGRARAGARGWQAPVHRLRRRALEERRRRARHDAQALDKGRFVDSFFRPRFLAYELAQLRLGVLPSELGLAGVGIVPDLNKQINVRFQLLGTCPGLAVTIYHEFVRHWAAGQSFALDHPLAADRQIRLYENDADSQLFAGNISVARKPHPPVLLVAKGPVEEKAAASLAAPHCAKLGYKPGLHLGGFNGLRRLRRTRVQPPRRKKRSIVIQVKVNRIHVLCIEELLAQHFDHARFA
mmetsp:Transcript_95099/g.290873  ORF Transcript_95099/g.290873 Transcript_95099/m.290873 type:complete len:252 (-) Transcript_95099:70-825(-)